MTSTNGQSQKNFSESKWIAIALAAGYLVVMVAWLFFGAVMSPGPHPPWDSPVYWGLAAILGLGSACSIAASFKKIPLKWIFIPGLIFCGLLWLLFIGFFGLLAFFA